MEFEALAVQLDGSDADLELAGYRVMRLTWDDVTVHEQRTERRLRLALGVA